MAKKNAVPKEEKTAEKPEAEKQTASEEKAQKKIKVKILETLRGTYGAFNPGETAEIEAKTAEAFIRGGLAEKI